MTTLAPVMGVSTALISDACKEHHIPTPPRGYWSKVRAGGNLPTPQLPSRPLGMSNTVRIGKPRRIEHAPDTCVYENLADVRKRVKATINQKKHAGSQQRAHTKRSEYLWHFLTAALADFDGSVLVEVDQPSKAIVTVYHHKVAIWIVDAEATTGKGSNANRNTFQPLQVCMAERTYSNRLYRTWQDEDEAPFEAKMPDIATEAIVCAERQQRRAEARVDENRFLDQQPHQYEKMENQSPCPLVFHGDRSAVGAALLKQATDYESAKSLRNLLEAVRNAYPSDANAKINRWCDLISAEIQALDPLRNKQFLHALDIDGRSGPTNLNR